MRTNFTLSPWNEDEPMMESHDGAREKQRKKKIIQVLPSHEMASDLRTMVCLSYA